MKIQMYAQIFTSKEAAEEYRVANGISNPFIYKHYWYWIMEWLIPSYISI